jgi:hypothetical protein
MQRASGVSTQQTPDSTASCAAHASLCSVLLVLPVFISSDEQTENRRPVSQVRVRKDVPSEIVFRTCRQASSGSGGEPRPPAQRRRSGEDLSAIRRPTGTYRLTDCRHAYRADTDPLGCSVWRGSVPSRLLGRRQGPVGLAVADRSLSSFPLVLHLTDKLFSFGLQYFVMQAEGSACKS